MQNTPTPQNAGIAGVTIGIIAGLTTDFVSAVREALAENLVNWFLSQDWVALIEWCLFQTATLQHL